uniref:Uncharacterized protein n=1 Tax=viral metagenome TaxID=1070528 RepID=A0A6C0BZY2_9ZZZZ
MLEHAHDVCVYGWFTFLASFAIACFIISFRLWHMKTSHRGYAALSFTILCAGVTFALAVGTLVPFVQTDTYAEICVSTMALFFIWCIALAPLCAWKSSIQVEHTLRNV